MKSAKTIKKKTKGNSFPIVVIGASEGGLKTVTQLLQNLSADPGMAFIYAQLHPEDKTKPASVLSGVTKMNVKDIEDLEHISPNNVYVIPYDKEIEVAEGHIKVIPRAKNILAVSTDAIFSLLGEMEQKNIIGLVLSDKATEGFYRLKDIKRTGGIVFSRDYKEKFKGTVAQKKSLLAFHSTLNEMLTDSYNYAQAIIETIHEPLLVLDENFRIRSASKSFYKKFLVNEEKTEGKLLFELGNKQWDIPELHSLLEEVISKNENFNDFEVTHKFPHIGKKIMLLNARRMVRKIDHRQFILLAIDDITERTNRHLSEKDVLKKDIRRHEADKLDLEKAVKRRTKELGKKNTELEIANRDLTAFNYISSHDLQEPLRKMQNFVALLLKEEKGRLSKSGKDYLHRADETAKRMQMLIEDLLTYSRTSTSERKFEKTDLNIILEELKKDFAETIKKKKVIIKANGLCVVNVIPFQFRQLLHNLISNSLKFSRPNKPPRIIIKSKIVPGNKLNNKNLSPKTNYCHLTFADNGIGFDPKYKDRIFEVFQRLHEFDKYKGTGIGLSICKRIVENHHGIITATGKLNKGARFDIYIPAS